MIIRKFEVIVAVPEDGTNNCISADKICDELRKSETLEDCAVEVREVYE